MRERCEIKGPFLNSSATIVGNCSRQLSALLNKRSFALLAPGVMWAGFSPGLVRLEQDRGNRLYFRVLDQVVDHARAAHAQAAIDVIGLCWHISWSPGHLMKLFKEVDR